MSGLMMESKGMRIQREAEMRGDLRERCDAEGHAICEGCRECACIPEALLDRISYPNGFRVTTDKQCRTICRECRYLEDQG